MREAAEEVRESNETAMRKFFDEIADMCKGNDEENGR